MCISNTETCLSYNNYIETIENIYLESENVIHLLKTSEEWVKSFYDCHFKVADLENIICEHR